MKSPFFLRVIGVFALSFFFFLGFPHFAAAAEPSSPTSLGPASLVDGSATTTNTPTFTFTLADSDIGDLLSYRIVIDNNSDFSSPVVYYTSADGAHGVRSFQVGQAVGGGGYSAGSGGQTLASGSYYWQVSNSDGAVSSAYTQANGGAIAFVIGEINNNPDLPTELGPTDLVDGSTTSTATPTFQFTLTDPDVADTLQYVFQIDDSADFGSLIVNYGSIQAAQGTKYFQVGQAAGTGVYTTGSFGQTLANGSYYWRVLAYDPSLAGSGAATANGGEVAFDVDTDMRLIQFSTSTGSGLESVTATSVKITLDEVHAFDVTVSYTVTGGTASGSGVDFTSILAPTPITIPAGQTSTTFSFDVVNDAIAESVETIIFTLSSASGGTLGPLTTYTYTITDNDTVGVSLSEGAVAITEAGVTDAYTVVLTSSPTSTVQILLSTTSSQFTLSTSTLTFTTSNWNTPQTVTVTAVDDSTVESTEYASIALVASSTGSQYIGELGISMVAVTITDNDLAPVVRSGGGGGGGGGGTSSNISSLFYATTTVTTPIINAPIVINSPLVSAPQEILAPVQNSVLAPIIAPPIQTNGGCPAVTLPYITTTNRECLLSFLGLLAPDEAAELRARLGVQEDATEFGLRVYGSQLDRYLRFIAYGVSHATRRLGERERRAVVRDALQVIGYSATEADFHRLTVGLKPQTRNIGAESRQLPIVRDMFRKMYKHDPNFKNLQDDLAWNSLMYRIRFPRDLVKEKQGIVRFRSTFRRTPVSPLDWAAVRALGYIR